MKHLTIFLSLLFISTFFAAELHATCPGEPQLSIEEFLEQLPNASPSELIAKGTCPSSATPAPTTQPEEPDVYANQNPAQAVANTFNTPDAQQPQPTVDTEPTTTVSTVQSWGGCLHEAAGDPDMITDCMNGDYSNEVAANPSPEVSEDSNTSSGLDCAPPILPPTPEQIARCGW